MATKEHHRTYVYSKPDNIPIPLPEDDYALMGEDAGAAFCHLTPRAMQNFRLKGNGPRFIKIGSRCIRYRKIDLIEWQESQVRTSTSNE